MRDYYEEIWERMAPDLTPSDFEVRRSFLLGSVSPGERVLDLGCGQGSFSEALTGHGADVTAVDVADAALDRVRRRCPAARILRTVFDGPLPLADNEFDVVWAGEVIEHVADTARFLSEARRVLRPAGRLLITTPNHGRLRLLVGGIERYSEPLGDHLHLYTAASLREVMQELGFGEVKIRAVLGPPLARRLLLAHGVR